MHPSIGSPDPYQAWTSTNNTERGSTALPRFHFGPVRPVTPSRGHHLRMPQTALRSVPEHFVPRNLEFPWEPRGALVRSRDSHGTV